MGVRPYGVAGREAMMGARALAALKMPARGAGWG